MNLSRPKLADDVSKISLVDHPRLNEWPWHELQRLPDYASREDWPKISIIIPSYQQADFLEATIRSVVFQGYPNLELIIIDGGSTDGSVEIIKKYEQYLSYWVSEKDNGQADALTRGFNRATGEIFAWINSDDFYTQGTLKKIAEHYILEKFHFLCGSCRMIDQSGKMIQRLFTPTISFRSLIRYWKPHFCPPQPSMFFSRQAYIALRGLRTDLVYAMDFDLWIRASQCYEFKVIRDQLSFYRVHDASKTGSENGLRKFVPEWRAAIERCMKDQPPLFKFNYHLERVGEVFRKRINHFLRR